MTTHGSGKNLLHMAHNGSSSVIVEEEETDLSATSKPVQPISTTVNGDENITATIPQNKDETQTTQSYLALTKLGMGKKEVGEPNAESSNNSKVAENKPKKLSPKESKKPKLRTAKEGADKDTKKTKPMVKLW